MKLSHAMWAHPRWMGHGGGLTECGPLEKGMANHFSILALRTMNSMKTQTDGILKEELPRLVGAHYANEEAELKQNQHPVVDVSGGESKV